MSAYVVTLYVEGGEQDAESFVCGPYRTEAAAHSDARLIADFGTVEVRDLYADADTVRRYL